MYVGLYLADVSTSFWGRLSPEHHISGIPLPVSTEPSWHEHVFVAFFSSKSQGPWRPASFLSPTVYPSPSSAWLYACINSCYFLCYSITQGSHEGTQRRNFPQALIPGMSFPGHHNCFRHINAVPCFMFPCDYAPLVSNQKTESSLHPIWANDKIFRHIFLCEFIQHIPSFTLFFLALFSISPISSYLFFLSWMRFSKFLQKLFETKWVCPWIMGKIRW